LEDALRGAAAHGEPVRVLHILCHGAVRGHSFCLAWNDDHSDEPAIIDAGRLRQLLAQYAPHLRLVVLCACDSSNESTLGTQLGSLARSLHRVGIQTVIGSAVPLSSRGSIAFTQSFYRALVVERASVADSFLRARRALASHVRTLDWLALRFYAAPGDDQRDIFLPAPLPRARPPRVRRVSAEQPTEPRARAPLLALLFASIAGVALAIVLLRYWVPLHSPVTVLAVDAAPDASVSTPIDAGVPDALPRPPAPPPKRERARPPPHAPKQPITRIDSHGFRFELRECRLIVKIECHISITNLGEKRRLTIYRQRGPIRSLLYNQDNRLATAGYAVLDGKAEAAGWVGATWNPGQTLELHLTLRVPPQTTSISRIEVRWNDAAESEAFVVRFRNISLAP
ncbi:MAG TPA: CHAT domain-containing protein, partial [Haliangium sp.]|nr:CHAT domain-containing protein [Haliangium sp.]